MIGNTKVLYEYYKEGIYPFELIHRILTLNRKNQSGEARIVALQYPGDTNVLVTYDYKRESVPALRARMLFSPQRPPESLHLGLFRENFGQKLVMSKKELVFDLDITDFERYCSCRGIKRLCPICWIQMQGASLILEHILQYTMGYRKENRMWIFSGGKGLHCFINAEMAMKLGDDERKQLYKRFFIGQSDDIRLAAFVTTLSTKYPEFLKQVRHFFITHMIKGVDIFALAPFRMREDSPIEESFESFCLRHLRTHHGPLAQLVKGTWEGLTPKSVTTEDGEALKRQRVEHNISSKKWRALQQLEELRQDTTGYAPSDFLAMRLIYPMIDEGPLKIGHQIKLPFSVHHKSKNVALPLTHETIMKMDIRLDVLPVSVLCESKRNKKPLPDSFTTGLEIANQWVEEYPV